MTFSTDDVLCINVDGQEKPFDATGHRPILAGYDSLGRAHYVAVVRFKATEFVFTSVMGGGSSVRYTDGAGTHVTYNFKVIVLRHDPCDFHPFYTCIPSGAIDPTGHLVWRKDHFVEKIRCRGRCRLGLTSESNAHENLAEGEPDFTYLFDHNLFTLY